MWPSDAGAHWVRSLNLPRGDMTGAYLFAMELGGKATWTAELLGLLG